MKTKGKEIKRVKKTGKCCRCSEKAEPGKRQLCGFHWNQFRYARSLLGFRDRKTFTNAEVAAGRVGPSLRGKCRKRKNDYLESC
jgi:hypothetical protein